MRRIRRNGQTAIEYSLLIIVVLGALLAASFYLKRGIQGRWKEAVDDVGDQYDPSVASGTITHSIDSVVTTEIVAGEVTGGIETNRIDFSSATEKKDGSLSVGAQGGSLGPPDCTLNPYAQGCACRGNPSSLGCRCIQFPQDPGCCDDPGNPNAPGCCDPNDPSDPDCS